MKVNYNTYSQFWSFILCAILISFCTTTKSRPTRPGAISHKQAVQGLRLFRKRINSLTQVFRLDLSTRESTHLPEYIQRNRGLLAYIKNQTRDFTAGTVRRLYYIFKRYNRITEVLAGKNDYLKTKRGHFLAAFKSDADNSGQPFVLNVPNSYSTQNAYPLLIHLHGAGVRPNPYDRVKIRNDVIEAFPFNRGDAGYTGLGEVNILKMIAYIRRWYTIDPQRIHISGFSMGGIGAYYLATRYPDRFASVGTYGGAAFNVFYENLIHTPISILHGQRDRAVMVEASRAITNFLGRNSVPYTYHEYPAIGHTRSGMRDITDWHLSQRKLRSPSNISYICDHPRRGRCYWARIIRFKDPHRAAVLRATCSSNTSPRIQLVCSNIAHLSINPKKLPLRIQSTLSITINGFTLQKKYKQIRRSTSVYWKQRPKS